MKAEDSSKWDRYSTQAAWVSAIAAVVALLLAGYNSYQDSQLAEDQDKAGDKQSALAADVARHEKEAAQLQRAFEASVEQRRSAPLLTAGVQPSLIGKTVTLSVPGEDVTKRAEGLIATPTRLIVPVYNVGQGPAAVQGGPGFVQSCARQSGKFDPTDLELRGQVRELGYYTVPPGQSLQLRFERLGGTSNRSLDREIRSNEQPQLPRSTRGELRTSVPHDETEMHVVLFYTDSPLRRRLHWSCFDYSRQRSNAPSGDWSLGDVHTASRELEPGERFTP